MSAVAAGSDTRAALSTARNSMCTDGLLFGVGPANAGFSTEGSSGIQAREGKCKYGQLVCYSF